MAVETANRDAEYLGYGKLVDAKEGVKVGVSVKGHERVLIYNESNAASGGEVDVAQKLNFVYNFWAVSKHLVAATSRAVVLVNHGPHFF